MRIKLIYIAGQAYSGSTFLCALLGTHPNMVPVSEVSKWTKNKEIVQYCACGKQVKDCEFWVMVEKEWQKQTQSDCQQRYMMLQKKFEPISSVWKTTFIRSFTTSSDFKEFEEMTVALFRSISVVSDQSVIVDSSKLPGRALILSRMSGLNVSIIHLVRNGLRYLDSSLLRGKKISLNDTDILYKAFRLGIRWSNTNLASEWAMRKSGVKGIQVRYEDLVSRPSVILETISSALEIDLVSVHRYIESNQPISYRHMASGSGHRRMGPKPLTEEFNTLSDLDRSLKLSFYLGAALLSRKYGYLSVKHNES